MSELQPSGRMIHICLSKDGSTRLCDYCGYILHEPLRGTHDWVESEEEWLESEHHGGVCCHRIRDRVSISKLQPR